MNVEIKLEHNKAKATARTPLGLMVELTAPSVTVRPDQVRVAKSVVFVIDNSGSMAGPRLDIGGRNAARGTGCDDDGVVAGGVFQKDHRRAGKAFAVHRHLGGHPRPRPDAARHLVRQRHRGQPRRSPRPARCRKASRPSRPARPPSCPTPAHCSGKAVRPPRPCRALQAGPRLRGNR